MRFVLSSPRRRAPPSPSRRSWSPREGGISDDFPFLLGHEAATHNATQPMTLLDGTPLPPALGIGAFTEKTLVAVGRCARVDPAAPATAAGLLGCGVMAGFGAAVNTGAVGRGDSVAAIGCGGVGMAAVVGARIAGATRGIAVDVEPRRLERAIGMGATHTVDSCESDAVEAIREPTGGWSCRCSSLRARWRAEVQLVRRL